MERTVRRLHFLLKPFKHPPIVQRLTPTTILIGDSLRITQMTTIDGIVMSLEEFKNGNWFVVPNNGSIEYAAIYRWLQNRYGELTEKM